MRLSRWLILGCLGIFFAGCAEKTEDPQGEKRLRIGLMPKLVGIDYFNACEKGAKEAAAELAVDLTYNGPVTNDVTKQTQMLETWIAKGYDVIAVAPNDPDAIVPALKAARQKGIKVLTWDADSGKEGRDFFVNQAQYQDIAKTLMDVMAEAIGENGKYIILTGSLTAANQNIWMERMEEYRQGRYPKMVNLSPVPKATEEDEALAIQVTIDVLKSYPDVQGLCAITSVALPGAAEALRKEKAADRVFLTGLSTPNSMRAFIKDGTVKKFVLWDPVALGYLTVHAAKLLAEGKLSPNTTRIQAGRLGTIEIRGDEVLLGPPLVFDKNNIDQFDF